MSECRDFPGLEYLELVPESQWSRVVAVCGKSPTIGQLRLAIVRYGRLSEAASTILYDLPARLVYDQPLSSCAFGYWSSLLLEPLRTDALFVEEQTRRLGLSFLVGKPWREDFSILCQRALVGTGCCGADQSFGLGCSAFDVGAVRALFSTTGSAFSGLVSNVDEFEQDLTVDREFGFYARTLALRHGLLTLHDATTVAPASSQSGFCYLKLFQSQAHGRVSELLGSFPLSRDLAAAYFSGCVLGFSVLSGLTLAEVGILDPGFHVQGGCSSSEEVFYTLTSSGVQVGGLASGLSNMRLSITAGLPGRVEMVRMNATENEPPPHAAVVAVDDRSYEWYKAHFSFLRLERALYRPNDDTLHDYDEVWVVSVARLYPLDSDGVSVISGAFARTRRRLVFAIKMSIPTHECSGVVELSMCHEHSLFPFQDASVVNDSTIGRGTHVYRCLVDDNTSYVARLPRTYTYGVAGESVSPERYGVLLSLDDERWGEKGLCSYTAYTSFSRTAVVLIPPDMRLRVGGVTLHALGKVLCLVIAPDTIFGVDIDSSVPRRALVLTCFPYVERHRRWMRAGPHGFDTTSSESRFASNSLYLSFPTLGCASDAKKVEYVEVSEPLDPCKAVGVYRVRTGLARFCVDFPYGGCLISRYYCSGGPLPTLSVGLVDIRDSDSQVYVDSTFLKTCVVSGLKDGQEVSFNISMVVDPYCYDDGGPSEGDDFESGF